MSSTARHQPDLVVWQVLLFAALLLALRLAGIFNLYFFEEDEVAIATGIATLVQGNATDLYRYTPQLGYYRLLEGLDLLAGANLALIPVLMKTLSALAGTLLPLSALFAFRAELDAPQRWLAALVLVANPIVWKSSQYGNTAMLATALGGLALVLLSNRPALRTEQFALLLFAAAITVRADTVLLAPAVAALLLWRHGSLWRACLRGLPAAALLVLLYLLLFAFDPMLDDAARSVATHFSLTRPTQFWEFLLWAVSPLSLAFAVLGCSRLLDTRPAVLLIILVWILGPFAFYFTCTTTPRYFLLAVLPLAIASGTGIRDLAGRLSGITGTRLAWTAVLGAAFLHLCIGLGQFPSAWKAAPLFAPTLRTDDGDMPTGALIYDTYLRDGFLHQSWRNAGFGHVAWPYWEGVAFNRAIERLRSPLSTGHTTVFLMDSGLGVAIHYHAQLAGAQYLSRAPADPSLPFVSETWFRLGAATVMTIGRNTPYYRELAQFRIAPGDWLWVMGDRPFPDDAALAKLPPGLALRKEQTFDPNLRVFRVITGASDDTGK